MNNTSMLFKMEIVHRGYVQKMHIANSTVSKFAIVQNVEISNG